MQALQSNLRPCKRHMTTNNAFGVSIFSSMSTDPPAMTTPEGMRISFCYGTDRIPAQIAQDNDLTSYDAMVHNPPGIVIPNGTAFRIVDFPPAHTTAMHRTLSVNFNVVVEGQVELVLESGETRLLNRGDSVVQRYVNHAWRNTSATDWVRIVAVPIPAEPVQFQSEDGKTKNLEVHTTPLTG